MTLFGGLPENVERDLHELQQDARGIRDYLREIAFLLRLAVVGIPATGAHISQVGGNKMITGVPLGGTGTFKATLTPPGGQLQRGSTPQWATGDASVTLTPSSDGMQVDAAVASTETLTSFGLTFSAVGSDGNPFTASTSVPILAAAVVPATGATIDQIA